MMRSDRFETQKIDAIAQLAGAVAHDFDVLLTAILGHAEQLSHNIGPGDPRAFDLAGIRDAAQTAAALTGRLLAVSRRQTRKPKCVNLNDVVDRARGVLHRLAGDGVAFDLRLDAELKYACVDAEQIEQILLNLVVNARDAMPSGGALTVETRNVTLDEATAVRRDVAAGSYVELTVADTGIGIHPSIRPHVFEPFFTTKEPRRAAGLGLATVHGIVTQSGGHIVVDSDVGRGSRFGICFPATTDAVTLVVDGALKQSVGSATVLLFENDQPVRTLVRDVLRRRGYHLLVASDAAETMKFAAEHRAPIDLLITERATEAERDAQIVDAVRQCRPDVRVLYLDKPFTPDALARKVRAALAAA